MKDFGSTRNGVSPISGSYNPVNSVFGIFFRVVFAILLFVAIFRLLGGSPDRITFTGLLNTLVDAPQISTAWITDFVQWGESLGAFPFIGDLLVFLSRIISVNLYVAVGAIQVITYVGFVSSYLFM